MIPKTYIHIDGIHIKSNCFKVLFKDIIYSVGEFSIDIEMLERLPRASYQCAPMPMAEMIAEIIRGYLPISETYFLTDRTTFS